ncbi:MAG: hypothetical protein GTO14_22930, partial [Anaerolineales bacterium]|nr:hypothetical protein [Anaerolineales bacterium]
FLTSLGMLSDYIKHQPWGDDIAAIRAEFGFLVGLKAAQTIMSRCGFDVVLLERPGGRFWRKAFWENLYSYLLMWAFNPRSLRGKSLIKLVRAELWISRERLAQLYGTRPT